MGYKVKVKKIAVVNEAGDRTVVITAYLIDTAGSAIQAVDNSITFDVRAPKSSLPVSGRDTWLVNLTKDQISKKYNRYLTVTKSPTHNTNKLLFNSTDVSKLFNGLTVIGPGISTTANLDSITTPTEIQLSSVLTMQITGTTVAPSISMSGTTVLDSTTVTVANTTSLIGGMSISGTGIPYGSIILSVVTGTTFTINQKATVSGTNTLTFATITDSIYLTAGTSYFTSTVYEGLTIAGISSIPRNTTIDQVISATKIKLFNNATAAATGTCTISGSCVYYFDTVNLTLDTNEISAIVTLPIIDFDNL